MAIPINRVAPRINIIPTTLRYTSHQKAVPILVQRCFTSTSKCQNTKRPSKMLSSLLDILKQKGTSKKKSAGVFILDRLVTKFPQNPTAKGKAKKMGIDHKLFSEISPRFVEKCKKGKVSRLDPLLIEKIVEEEGPDGLNKLLMSSFYEYAEPYLPQTVLKEYSSLRKLSDLRFPSEWFPEARQMQRKIILHVGPTNSGKTYRAIQRLQSAESGIYCGPLRLLAHEIFEKMNKQGVECNLLTGEERREVSPTAPLTSSTVEMANLAKPLEVAVIDEIQLIADPYRGWAWTQALLGLKAKEIHLCGEAAAVPLIKSICESLGEQVVVNEYERLTPVSVATHSLDGDYKKIQKGDCVVAFSRKSIFAIKERIEKETGLQCAVAYGGLPPETRALQAKSFNDPNLPVNVLVASDAVGMGLNLNIKRVIFSTVKKFDGRVNKFMQIPQLKQIAGRAGRFGTTYASGEVTTLYNNDLKYVKDCLEAPIIPLELAGLQPTVDIVEVFALQMPNERYSSVLQKFEDLASVQGEYFLCNFKDQKTIADSIETIKLSLRDRYQFVTAPVSTRNEDVMSTLETMARTHSNNETLELPDLIQLPTTLTSTPESLTHLEVSHKKIMLYMWLSLRFPDTFITLQSDAVELKEKCEQMIDEGLLQSSLAYKFKKASKPRVQMKKKETSRKKIQLEQRSSI